MPFDAPTSPAIEAEASRSAARPSGAKPAPQPAAASGVMARARALLDKQLHIVGKLAELGIARARAMLDDWSTPPDPPPASAGEARQRLKLMAVASARVNRGVRLAVLLRQRLICELRKLHKGGLAAAEGVLKEVELPGLSREVTLNLRLDEVLRGLAAVLGQPVEPSEPAAGPAGDAPAPIDAADGMRPDGRSETVHVPSRAAGEAGEPRTVDPLRRYVWSRPVGVLIEEICEEIDLPLDGLRMMEQLYDLAAETSSSPARNAGEGDHEVVEGASPAHGPPPPPSLRDTSPAGGGGRDPQSG